MSRILITGGSGYIGSSLVNKIFKAASNADNEKLKTSSHTISADQSSHLLYNIEQVTVYDNLLYKQTTLLDQCYRDNFRFIYGDVRNLKQLREEVRNHDVIIPLAALVGAPLCSRDPKTTYEINRNHVMEICLAAQNNQKIIYPNTNSGYGIGVSGEFCTEESLLNPISDYGISKCQAEKYVLDYGGITLRLATVFGLSPRMRLDLLVNDFIYKAVNDKYIVLFEKDFKRNYIHVQDVALTFIYMINKYNELSGQTYNVGLSDANLSKLELCEKIKQYIPEFVIKYDDYAKDPDKRDYIVSNEKIEKTGWKPYYSLDNGIQELIKGYEIIKNNNKLFTNL